MVQNIAGEVKFAPLFIHSFPLLAPHHLLESEKFNIRFSDPSEITEIADKLRWYRYSKALLQREIADYIGVDRSTYIHYEEYGRDYYPLEHMEKLAALYGVPVTELLDDFNMFLYNDQGKQIREKRLALGMTQSEYRYAKDIVYNNFPWCNPTTEQKKKIEETAQAILDARALYPDCSLADLYDEVAMPPELRKAHQANDRAVMQAYGFEVKTMTESTCVAELMKMYQKMVNA